MNLVGDPAAINAMASLIDRKAGQLADLGRRVKERADRCRGKWECAKADRFRHTIDGRRQQAQNRANDLHDLARQLRAVAVQVESELSALHGFERLVRNALSTVAHDAALSAKWAATGWSHSALPATGDPAWRTIAKGLGV